MGKRAKTRQILVKWWALGVAFALGGMALSAVGVPHMMWFILPGLWLWWSASDAMEDP